MNRVWPFTAAALVIVAAFALAWWLKPSSPFLTANTHPAAVLTGAAQPPVTPAQPSPRTAKPASVSLSPDEVARRLEGGLGQLAEHIQSSSDRASGATLSKEKSAQLRDLADAYGVGTEARTGFDHNRNLSSLHMDIPLPGVASLDANAIDGALTTMVQNHGGFFGLNGSGEVASVATRCSARLCNTRVQKSFAGLPAWDHAVVITSSGAGTHTMLGEFEPPRVDLQQLPQPHPDAAVISTALADHFSRPASAINTVSEPALGIARESGHDFLAYRVTVELSAIQRYDVFVDADTLRVAKALPLVFQAPVAAQGTNLDGDVINFEADQQGNVFGMVDTRFPLNQKTTLYTAPEGTFQDPFNGVQVVASNSASGGWNPAAVSALDHAKRLVDYFKNTHGYDAVNETGKDMRIVVDVGFSNAFALGDDLFVFGAGTGPGERNWAASLDIMAHEIMHGVIATTSSLEYRNQSGALNESFADFFGAALDPEDWHVGEDVFINPNLFIRDLANPILGNQPAHFADYVQTTADNGGVHINSGIPNRAQYLLAEGLTAEGLGTSVGRTTAEVISFETMKALDPNATFADAALAMESVAAALYGGGSAELQAVTQSWQLVGIPPTDTTIDPGSGPAGPVVPSNAAVHLSPILNPAIFGVEGNIYDLYVQFYDNDSPTYVGDDDFGPLNLTTAAFTRPTLVIFNDASFLLVFKGSDGEVYTVESSSGNEEVFDLGGLTVADLAFTPDGSKVILTVAEAPAIFTYELATGEITSALVAGPTYTEGAPAIPVELVDTVRVDPTSRKIVFDFLTCAEPIVANCDNPSAAKHWAIGVLDIASGDISYPFPSQAANIDLGYPSFSNLTDQYIVFDLVNRAAPTSTGFESLVVVYDQVDRSLEFVSVSDLSTAPTGAFSSPSFTADDGGVTFAVRQDGPGSLLFWAELDNYALATGTDRFRNINPFNSFLPFSVPSVTLNPIPTLDTAPNPIDIGQAIKGRIVTSELCATNNGDFPIQIGELSTTVGGIGWTGVFNHLEGGEEICGTFSFNTTNWTAGQLNTVFAILHDGANSPTPVTVTGSINLDSDADGIIDSIDTDDDNDGLLDTDEINVYGTDPLARDTDRDGLDDGTEIELGLDPLDSSDCPENLCPEESFIKSLIMLLGR